MEVEEVNLLSMSKIIIKKNVVFCFFIMIITILLLVVTRNFKISCMGIMIYFFGYIGSVLLHEYMHMFFMRLFGIKKIHIYYGLMKFSIFTKEHIYGVKLMIIAISGPVACIIMGIGLLVVYKFINVESIYLISICYLFHLINLFPLLGDGRMALKGMLTLKGKDV